MAPSIHLTASPTEQADIFRRLQELCDDFVVVHIAYGCYKETKRDWIEDETRRLGHAPAPAEISAFVRSQKDPILKAYIAIAEDVVDGYNSATVAAATDHIVSQALKGSFWRSVWESFVASVLFTLLLAALVFVAAMMGIGLPIQFSVG